MEKTPRKKRALLVIGGIVAALALAVLALLLFVDINGYKPRLEAAASKAVGLTVRIRGEMKIEFFPPFGLLLPDIQVARDGQDVLRVERMQVGLKILPLLWGKVRFRELGLGRPEFSIQRTTSGPFDFARYVHTPLRNVREALPGAFDRIDEILVTGGKIFYAGKDPAIRADLEGLDLAIRDIVFQGNPGDDPFRNASFAGTVKAARATFGSAEASNIAGGITAKNGNYEFSPVTLKAFGGTGEGSVRVSLTESTPFVHVQYSLTGLRVEELCFASGRKRGLLEGKTDISANLLLKRELRDEWTRTVKGDLSMTGKDLAVVAFDPDELLSVKGKGKEARLARMGALLLPCPDFTAAAGGLSGPYATMENDGRNGRVKTFVSRWTVENGMFEAKDVALATKGHRVALSGKIDLPGESFDDLTVALVDDRGCVITGQTIRGPFRLPRIAEAIVSKKKEPPGERPMVTPKELVPGEDCAVFYAGTVPPPE